MGWVAHRLLAPCSVLGVAVKPVLLTYLLTRNKPFGEAMGNNHPNMASTGYFGLPRGISARDNVRLLALP